MIFIKSTVAILLSISAASAMYIYWPEADTVEVSEIEKVPEIITPKQPEPITIPEPMAPMAPKPAPQPEPKPDNIPIGVAGFGTGAMVILCMFLDSVFKEEK